mmetsp:Transcript_31931/g.67134  ORF Transcript_31931/g.67134 Transcript_31931/m.67134 type:complete len:320 (-) Transcript_31931:225-1184(-)
MMMDSSFLLKYMVAGFFVLAFANAFIAIPPTPVQRSVLLLPRIGSNKNGYRSWKLFYSEGGEGDRGPTNDSTSNNEFSRTIRVSKWFSSIAGSTGNRFSKKTMDLSISATEEERHALATRFRLKNITALSADLVVQPVLGGGDASGSGGRGGNIDDSECIEARGTVCAQVTQKCVRTNEEFDVSLEFSFETVLKAQASQTGSSDVEIEPLSLGEMAALDAASKLDNKRSQKKKGGNKKRGIKGVRGGQGSKDLDGSGMKQLQDILMEYEVTDEIIEDESCFCTDGIVDCGEVVAQMFRSKLDPYPKKPGSDPVSYSFTF